MKQVYVYQHLGLGDHIICNGLIRKICNSNEDVTFYFFCKGPYAKTIHSMYKDLKNIKILGAYSSYPDNSVAEFIVKNKLGTLLLNHNVTYNNISELTPEDYPQLLKIGHEFFINDVQFDHSFYKQLKLDFSHRWDSFHVPRNYKPENDLYSKYISSKPYKVIHEDIERGMCIQNLDRSNSFIIRNDITDNIFDYLTIFENASEIHCIESCFLFLIDSYNFNAKLFSHRYARQYPPNLAPTLRNNWTIL